MQYLPKLNVKLCNVEFCLLVYLPQEKGLLCANDSYPASVFPIAKQ